MRVFAYCTYGARRTVAAATGVRPKTSPPIRAATFNPEWMEDQDLLYFRLHGQEGRPGWFNDEGTLALTPIQASIPRLRGAVVVVGNCYGGNDDVMVETLYRSGASVVIAGKGANVAAANQVVGTDLLVQWIIRGMNVGLTVGRALGLARMRLGLTSWRPADRDAREFDVVAQKMEQVERGIA